jgi:hypothetical protein
MKEGSGLNLLKVKQTAGNRGKIVLPILTSNLLKVWNYLQLE